ncbi:sugar phosphate isomerase/epimerase [Sinomonas albida]|uniref:sugar phosphate isomerase/epimerase family protein n=1 Tax=Sinomonas albida TaxID=369942 RepID=UPI003019017E
MKDTLRWAYALNQWNPRMDVFVRHEEQLRAFQTVSVLGFDHIELSSGTGRWDNLGRPETILLNHGSIDGLKAFLGRGSLAGVSSMFWDPGQPVEEEGWAFRTPLDPSHHDGIVEAARPFVQFLAAMGAEQLVVRPVGSAWMTGLVDEGAIRLVAALWNRVGEEARASGIGVAAHYDCLSGIHTQEQLETFLAALDPALVGLALDTAEFAIAGIDPVAFLRDHGSRVTHVHLKDARYADTGEEFLTPGAETTMLRGGAGRRIERWFYELGAEGGLVDVDGFVGELRAQDYRGWVVVESDHGSNPSELAMLNSWFIQHELGVARV